MTSADALDQQRSLYGAPLADLVSEATRALGLTQGRLAEVLGLSAPMLSQLLSGQRVKIGNPAAVHRLQAVLALARQASGLSADAVAHRLAEIRAEQATLTSDPASDAAAAARALGRVLPTEELLAAAGQVGSPALAALLRQAADLAGRG
ncbi:DNA-binding protein [Phycicoccus sp. HDW14]|uniref:helix-turn-helix domain-containing protein n=1 Tax=Phycicoccus sp. HDW14 TaxID=2714941 RepID=UPI001409E19F|nr:DNA-binding protein [Phycicoccus sp. HDW14]QIM21506.1 DNA-binding protein [Phycicoccus sp. HDW14]